jgi:hypothetical protein
MILDGLVASADGRTVHRHRMSGPAAAPEQLGVSVAEYLLARAGGWLSGIGSAETAPGTRREIS